MKINYKFITLSFLIIILLLSTFLCIEFFINKESNSQFSQEISTLSLQNWKEKYDSEDYEVIDIRTLEEYSQGHISNSQLIDFYGTDFSNTLNQLDKSKKYLIYCRSGSRSSSALEVFKQLDFLEVYELQGGVLSWTAGGLDLEK